MSVTTIDRETHSNEQDHASLRLWLRLLTCTTLIETEVRTRLREEFEITLPRFDLMAQLERHRDGLRMGELSQRMMVSGGNVTGITDQLERDGLVERIEMPGDRRSWCVRLTEAGRQSFQAMARTHEAWIINLMQGLTTAEQQQLYSLLSKLKQGVSSK